MADHNVDWEPCAKDGCSGVRLPTGDKCWAHAADTDVDAALKRLGEHGRVDARGVTITQELLGRLLAAAPQDEHGHAILTDARFGGATFEGAAGFNGATFQGAAGFDGATFQGDALFAVTTFQRDAGFEGATFRDAAGFGGATFQGAARFDAATVQGVAWFRGATFQNVAWFDGATFQRETWFDEATFQGDAWFDAATFRSQASFAGGASFKGDAWFRGVTFQGAAGFGEATFQRDAGFDGASFKGTAWFRGTAFKGTGEFGEATFQREAFFDGATFQRDAGFDGATFQRARQLGPMLVRRSLQLDQAVFHQRAQIEVSAAAVCCQRVRFPAGVQLRIRWAQVVLDDADLAAPSILTGASAFQGLQEGRWARALEQLQPTGTRAGQPRLLSLQRADVAGLTVAGVDMRACRFIGAHHLDQLRLEESHFTSTPRGWWWTTRQTIAEEDHWRATSLHGVDLAAVDLTSRGSHQAAHSAGWYRLASRPPAWLEVEPPTPAQIAALYRALRKGREDNKDEPGAADFYYGEMEMRRYAKREEAKKARRDHYYRHWAAATTERAVLWLYWLVSGYGLRAWRALAALAVLIGLVGVGFSRVGFHHPHPSQVASWLYALQATVSLEGKARQLSGDLTLPGELLRVGDRRRSGTSQRPWP